MNRGKCSPETRINQGKSECPKKAGYFSSFTLEGIQQKAEITRGAIYDAIANIKVSKNFKKDCIYN